MAQGDSQSLVRQTTPRADLIETEARDPEQIRRDIEQSRRQIADSLGQLRSEVSSTVDRALDWQGWVRNNPRTAVGIAFGVGLYFGLR